MLTASSALALAACGGGEQQVERRAVVGPKIPAELAERLARRSDEVASLLEAGDACGARKEAAALRADLTESIGEIPALYVEDLSGLVNEIEAQIPLCAEQQPPPRGNDRKKKDKKDKKDDDEGDD